VPTPEYDLNSRSMVGSGTPETLQWAARHGWGYTFAGLAHNYATLDNAVEVERVFREAAFEAGKDPSALLTPQHILCFCAETDEKAAEIVKPYMMEGTLLSSPHGGKTPLTGPQEPTGTPEQLVERTNRTFAEQIFGSPETCIEKIKYFQAKCQDLNYIVLSIGRGGIPSDIAIKSLKLFAEEVMPAFNVEIPEDAVSLARS
jgi:alkanesulfonate monooxygenase SsuD/methylene tetrahydromethanopterin reductase-like flavin-dependent oxidoreductase (luciferase family)